MVNNIRLSVAMASSLFAMRQEGGAVPGSFEISRIRGSYLTHTLEGIGTDSARWVASGLESPEVVEYFIPVSRMLCEVRGRSRIAVLDVRDQLLAAMDACGGSCGICMYLGKSSNEGWDFSRVSRPIVAVRGTTGRWEHGGSPIRPTLLMDETDPRMIGSHTTAWGEFVFITDRGQLAAHLKLGLSPQEPELRQGVLDHHDLEDQEMGGAERCLTGSIISKGTNPRACMVGSTTYVGIEDTADVGKPVTVRLYSSGDLLEWKEFPLPGAAPRPLDSWQIIESSGSLYFLASSNEDSDQACELWELSMAGSEWRHVVTERMPLGSVRISHSPRGGGPVFISMDEEGKLQVR